METKTLVKIVQSIVAEQQLIIGPLAVEQANKVIGVNISADLSHVEVKGNAHQILKTLVTQYEKLFGQASLEVCREAVKQLLNEIPLGDVPEFLR